MEILVALLIIVWLVIFIKIRDKSKALNENHVSLMEQAYNSLSDFHATRIIRNFNFIFAIDESKEKVLFINYNGNKIEFQYSELLDCNLVEDGYCTQNSYHIGTGVLGDSVGVFGGITQHQRPKERVSFLGIVLMLDNISAPRMTIVVFDAQKDYGRDSVPISGEFGEDYKRTYVRVLEIVDILNLIIRRRKII